jgi:hypothetical protein
MDNIYLKKLFTLHGLALFILFIILNSSNTYLKTYIMDYFMFDELTQFINIGPFSIQLSWIIGVVITLLMTGVHEVISFRRTMNKVFGTKI